MAQQVKTLPAQAWYQTSKMGGRDGKQRHKTLPEAREPASLKYAVQQKQEALTQ